MKVTREEVRTLVQGSNPLYTMRIDFDIEESNLNEIVRVLKSRIRKQQLVIDKSPTIRTRGNKGTAYLFLERKRK